MIEYIFKVPFILKDDNDELVDFFCLKDYSSLMNEAISNILTLVQEDNNKFEDNFICFSNKRYKDFEKKLSGVYLIEDEVDEYDFNLFFLIEAKEKLVENTIKGYLYWLITEKLDIYFKRYKIFGLTDEDYYGDNGYYDQYEHYVEISFENLIPSQIIPVFKK